MRTPIATIIGAITLLALLTVTVAGETQTWEDEPLLDEGEYDRTVYDRELGGITLDGAESIQRLFTNPVLNRGAGGAWNQKVYAPSVSVVNDRYVMYFGAANLTKSIGRATSIGPWGFSLDPSGPIMQNGSAGTYDSDGVMFPSVLYEDGTWKMWYIGTNTSSYHVCYAESEDGTNWTKHPSNPVLIGNDTYWVNGNYIVSPEVIRREGGYWMYFTGYNTSYEYAIGLAFSVDGVNWDAYPDPVVQKDFIGEYGGGGVWGPSVFKDGYRWRMLFGDLAASTYKSQLRQAWSIDGINWVRVPPVLLGPGHRIDSSELEDPCVLRKGSSYLVYYGGDDVTNQTICMAVMGPLYVKFPGNPTLKNGTTYNSEGAKEVDHVNDYTVFFTATNGTDSFAYATKASNGTLYNTTSPVFEKGASGKWDSSRISNPQVIYARGLYHLFYTGQGSGTSSIGYAYGINMDYWTRHPSNPVLTSGPAGGWEAGDVYHPVVVYHGERFHMWYLGGRGSLGYATSNDGSNWTKSSMNPLYTDFTIYNVFDIVWENGRWVMYYYDQEMGFIARAYSDDGLRWTRDQDAAVLISTLSDQWDWLIDDVSVLITGTRKEIAYVGKRYLVSESFYLTQVGFATFESGGTGEYVTPVLDASTHWPVRWGTISWKADLPISTDVRFQVAVNNGGELWSFVGPDGTGNSYFDGTSTTIPEFLSGSRIRVRALLSSGMVELHNPVLRSITVSYMKRPGVYPPTVEVTSPNGGEDWMKTKVYPITWTALGNFQYGPVMIDYSTDNGSSWTPIAGGYPNTGFYNWTVPNTETSGALVRVSVYDMDGAMAFDISDATFAIDPPPPKGGEFWSPASGEPVAPGEHTASWTVHDPWGLADRPLTLELTTDGGVTWSLLADGISLTDTYEWQVPDLTTSSDRCRLRLSVLDWLGGISVIESGEFTIDVMAPTVTLDPLGGKVMKGRSVQVMCSAEDDIAVNSVTLHVQGEEGERTYLMDLGEDGTWSFDYVPEEGDFGIYATASDNAYSTRSVVQHVKVKEATEDDPARSLAWELWIVLILCSTIVVAAYLLRWMGQRDWDEHPR